MSEREQVIAVLVEDYAALLAGTDPLLADRWRWLSPPAYVGYERGLREALLRVAMGLGVGNLPDRAAALLRQQEAADPSAAAVSPTRGSRSAPLRTRTSRRRVS